MFDPACASAALDRAKGGAGTKRNSNPVLAPEPSSAFVVFPMKALLVLEDGRAFEGESFGAAGSRVGEVCFNTSMTGYQEVLTDPSYRGQIVAMTYPLIGNCGVNPADAESDRLHVSGFVIEELSERPSSWRSRQALPDYLAANGVPGIQGIDTRALTRHLRERGALKGCLTTDAITIEEARQRAVEGEGVVNMDFVQAVTTGAAYDWDPSEEQSQRWGVPGSPDALPPPGSADLPPVRYRIVAYDYGLKRNILRRLRQHGFQVRVVPAGTPAADVLALDPDGIFLSPGPGDPGALDYVHESVRGLVGRKPIFGICLGHQMLACAFGGKTFKLPFGHHGGNQPVKDLRGGKVDITAQNHGFAVDPDSLPAEVEVTHVNLNDHTVEGLRHRSLPIFSVQYHPEAAPGPHDALHFFGQFGKLIDASR